MTLEPSETKPQYYHWTDIFIGLEMDVYARKLRFVDADVKTRQFYAHHGIPLSDAELPPEPVVVVYEREIPHIWVSVLKKIHYDHVMVHYCQVQFLPKS